MAHTAARARDCPQPWFGSVGRLPGTSTRRQGSGCDCSRLTARRTRLPRSHTPTTPSIPPARVNSWVNVRETHELVAWCGGLSHLLPGVIDVKMDTHGEHDVGQYLQRKPVAAMVERFHNEASVAKLRERKHVPRITDVALVMTDFQGCRRRPSGQRERLLQPSR